MLVDPTAGVDVASKEAILAQVRNLRHQGTALLLVSDDEEDLRVCDRILVMFQGHIVKEINAEWEPPDLVMAMEGWIQDSRNAGDEPTRFEETYNENTRGCCMCA